MAQVCVYMVTYVPPGCAEYTQGQFVEGLCIDGSCQDMVIGDGACKDAYLSAISCTCEESSGG